MLKETMESIKIEIELRKLEIRKAELDIICFRRELNKLKNENTIKEINEEINKYNIANSKIIKTYPVALPEGVNALYTENGIKIAELELKLEELENE